MAKKEKKNHELFEELSGKTFELIDYEGKPDPDGFDVSLILRDSSLPEDDETTITVDTFVECKYTVEDFGIGSYEFWGAKGVDTQLGYECQFIEFGELFPDNMKGVLEEALNKFDDRIREMDIQRDDDDYYDEPDPRDYYDDY